MFCEIWLNLIILFQSKILPPNSGEDQNNKRSSLQTGSTVFHSRILSLNSGEDKKKKKKVFAALAHSQSRILDFLLPSGYYLPKNQGGQNILPILVSDLRGYRPLSPTKSTPIVIGLLHNIQTSLNAVTVTNSS